eukprot:CAMPEP_0185708828 /NCGR_PEP_ID=MMETSP1164-20130828/27363_1 /TAXON_ID=1104430 /ORGANISM="Chrysoreinhardia sp, Strain CCMP2950" /LENGTH=74 /DNA_ID=CAMNT_0028376293 /DNA_START=294 /DNA_END=515 /DNA_ORIENTATION=+
MYSSTRRSSGESVEEATLHESLEDALDTGGPNDEADPAAVISARMRSRRAVASSAVQSPASSPSRTATSRARTS